MFFLAPAGGYPKQQAPASQRKIVVCYWQTCYIPSLFFSLSSATNCSAISNKSISTWRLPYNITKCLSPGPRAGSANPTSWIFSIWYGKCCVVVYILWSSYFVLLSTTTSSPTGSSPTQTNSELLMIMTPVVMLLLLSLQIVGQFDPGARFDPNRPVNIPVNLV